ncbi:phospholipase effector Tle1 domain-containing protein [Marivita cryptomonadis]|uniref:phospholipase effector Tle1 domain-containing protein n=1 Tax=Marivita cryptomonadis TaxID=505252 RepID=UPI00391DB60A
MDHVVILDGTSASSLYPSAEVWRICRCGFNGRLAQRSRHPPICRATVRRGINHALVGYSRGAYAVRSLAGAIDTIGLLNTNAVRQAYPLSTHGARLCAALLP